MNERKNERKEKLLGGNQGVFELSKPLTSQFDCSVLLTFSQFGNLSGKKKKGWYKVIPLDIVILQLANRWSEGFFEDNLPFSYFGKKCNVY